MSFSPGKRDRSPLSSPGKSDRSPLSSPVRQVPPRRGRSRSGGRAPKKVDLKELEEKFKELQQQRKTDETERKEIERQKKRQAVTHQQSLGREQKMVERDFLRREVEVDRLEKTLSKVQKETRSKSAKQSEMVAKIDDTLRRLDTKHRDLEQQLEEKVKEAALAKGRLAHVEFAHNLLNQGQVCILLNKDEKRTESGSNQGGKTFNALQPISPLLSLAEREQQLEQRAQQLRRSNQQRAEENARLRKQLEECRRTDASQHQKPAFACLGGELSQGTFYNLFDEGLDTPLGPGFSFFARIRYDTFTRGSKVFDFGNGEGMDNVYVGNKEGTNTLMFAAYQNKKATILSLPSFWPTGETHEYLFVVTPEGIMKVYCDGFLAGSKKGLTLKTTERCNLYVGRSNWPTDAPFEGSIAHIKIWNRDVEWIGAEMSMKASRAESWALQHSPPPATSASCTYPNGITLNFVEFVPIFSTVIASNAAQRIRLRKEIDSGNHMRMAVWKYQARGSDQQTHLNWQTGEVVEFVTAVFEAFSVTSPTRSQLYPLYAKFCVASSTELPALESFGLVDAALRVVCFSDSLGIAPQDGERIVRSVPAVQLETRVQPTVAGAVQRTASVETNLHASHFQPEVTRTVRSGSSDGFLTASRANSVVPLPAYVLPERPPGVLSAAALYRAMTAASSSFAANA